jgi:hypothetical protein
MESVLVVNNPENNVDKHRESADLIAPRNGH